MRLKALPGLGGAFCGNLVNWELRIENWALLG